MTIRVDDELGPELPDDGDADFDFDSEIELIISIEEDTEDTEDTENAEVTEVSLQKTGVPLPPTTARAHRAPAQ